MFRPADEPGRFPGELSRHACRPVQPGREMRTRRNPESGSWMAKTPLRLAEGACAVGTTQLHFVPPRGRQRCPQLYLPPRLHLPRASSCSLYLTTRDAGTWGPTLQPPKQQENEQGTSLALRAEEPHT